MIDRWIDRSIDRLADWSIGRSIDRSVDRSIDRSIDRLIDRSTDRSIGRSIDRSVDRANDRSIDRSMDRWIGWSVDRSVSQYGVMGTWLPWYGRLLTFWSANFVVGPVFFLSPSASTASHDCLFILAWGCSPARSPQQNHRKLKPIYVRLFEEGNDKTQFH